MQRIHKLTSTASSTATAKMEYQFESLSFSEGAQARRPSSLMRKQPVSQASRFPTHTFLIAIRATYPYSPNRTASEGYVLHGRLRLYLSRSYLQAALRHSLGSLRQIPYLRASSRYTSLVSVASDWVISWTNGPETTCYMMSSGLKNGLGWRSEIGILKLNGSNGIRKILRSLPWQVRLHCWATR